MIEEEKGFQRSKGEEKNSDRHAVFGTPAQAFCGGKKNALRWEYTEIYEKVNTYRDGNELQRTQIGGHKMWMLVLHTATMPSIMEKEICRTLCP